MALTADQQSAQATLNAALAQWGLNGLDTTAWQSYLNGLPLDTIMQNIRSSPEYQQRFPGMKQLQDSGQAISEADYIAKEAADVSLMRAYGLPDQVVQNRQLLGNLIANQVSTSELQQRLDTRQQIVNSVPEVASYARDQYGINTGDLIHFWENPDEALPLMQQKVQASQVGAAAQLAGYGSLDPQQALRLAGMGTSFSQALSGFEKAGELKGLTDNLPGQGQQVTGDQLTAATVGQDAQAALAVAKAQSERKAQFSDAANFATTQAGAVGLAQQNL